MHSLVEDNRQDKFDEGEEQQINDEYDEVADITMFDDDKIGL